MTYLLTDKTAIVYGAAGGLGAGVARAFAREGAHVVLAGRTAGTLDALAAAIAADGGAARADVVDVLDEAAVDAQLARVLAARGRIDVSFNLVSRPDVQGTPLVDLAVDDLLRAPLQGLRANAVTARAAARQMARQDGGGVILHLNSASGAGAFPGMGSAGPADAAIEAYYRYLAAETGRSGVRVAGIWTAGVAETMTDAKIGAVDPAAPNAADALAMIAGMSALGRAPSLADVAETAAFLASDRAAGITGSMTNVTAGLVLR